MTYYLFWVYLGQLQDLEIKEILGVLWVCFPLLLRLVIIAILWTSWLGLMMSEIEILGCHSNLIYFCDKSEICVSSYNKIQFQWFEYFPWQNTWFMGPWKLLLIRKASPCLTSWDLSWCFFVAIYVYLFWPPLETVYIFLNICDVLTGFFSFQYGIWARINGAPCSSCPRLSH